MKKKKSNRKLNKKRLIVFLIFFFLFLFSIIKITTTKITNIYVSGNSYLTDQEVIDIAGLKDYPKSINNLSITIKNRLIKNDYILSCKVIKKSLASNVYIEIVENYPMFYYQVKDKYILYDGKEVTKKDTVPTVINQIPSKVYSKFLQKIQSVDKNILYRISEIKYDPNDVDEERFFLIMNDGNYVYITLSKFTTINKYLEMINSVSNKKGILYLDSGEYFDTFD